MSVGLCLASSLWSPGANPELGTEEGGQTSMLTSTVPKGSQVFLRVEPHSFEASSHYSPTQGLLGREQIPPALSPAVGVGCLLRTLELQVTLFSSCLSSVRVLDSVVS